MILLAAADGGLAPSEGGIATTADPLAFEEAIEWFRSRVPVTRAQWDRLDEQSRRRARMVSDVAALDVVEQVMRQIDTAIANGDNFADFQTAAIESLGTNWTSTRPGRVETIFRTNVQSAYSAGRWQQITDPDVVATRPYVEFVAILDAATTPICRPLEGVVRPTGDAFWTSHTPPLHFNCRSSLMTLTARQGGARSAEPMAPHEAPAQGFGGTPDLAAWSPNAADYHPGLWQAFEQWTRTK